MSRTRESNRIGVTQSTELDPTANRGGGGFDAGDGGSFMGLMSDAALSTLERIQKENRKKKEELPKKQKPRAKKHNTKKDVEKDSPGLKKHGEDAARRRGANKPYRRSK